MELPQPSRIYAIEGRKTSHDFLSLSSPSPVQRDARSSHGEYLQTQDFLHPLEMEDKNSRKRNNIVKIDIEGTPPPVLPSSEAHLLHGGIGTYSIGHISSLNPTTPKPEGSYFTLSPGDGNSDRDEEKSNCKSYTAGSGFTLWEEPSIWKGKTEPTFNAGEWPVDRPSASSSSPHDSFSTQSVSRPHHVQNNQSLTKILNSAKGFHTKEEDEDGDFTFRGESTSQREDLHLKFNGKGSNDQIPNSTRSRHSATEQRRRCKINDSCLPPEPLLPATSVAPSSATDSLSMSSPIHFSFAPHAARRRRHHPLVTSSARRCRYQVIEYIQLLQEKVSRYEGSCPGWSSEPTKLMPWRNNISLAESLHDQPQGSLEMFKTDYKRIVIAPTATKNQHNPEDSNPPTATPIPADVSGTFPSTRNSGPVSTSNHHEPDIEGGSINISGIYSQGLLNTLTQALRISGVDLSQASISVQVDIGKRGQNALRPTTDKDFDTSRDGSTLLLREGAETNRSRDSSEPTKRLKTVKS